MRKKTDYLILATLLKITVVMGQQDPLYSQYINNPFVINPAYSGFTNNFNAAISYRKQWTGLEGSPETINASGHLSLFDNTMGAGLMIVSDKIGNTTVSEALATYAYRISLDKNKTLSFGLQAGMSNHRVDNSKVNPFDTTDPLFQGSAGTTKPVIGAGAILSSDKFFAGISVPRMLRSEVSNDGLQTTLYDRHFYVMGSYLFFLSERIRFKPSVLVKAVKGAPASLDANASFIFNENYQAGVLTRNFTTHGLFVQALFKDSFRFGYVLEVPTGSSVGSNFTTHEITLGVRMNVLNFHSNSSVFSF